MASDLPSIDGFTRHKEVTYKDVNRPPSNMATLGETNCDSLWPRIGEHYQADIDDLDTELAEDNAELLWDPDMISEDDLDHVVNQCQVSWASSGLASSHSGIIPPCSSPCFTAISPSPSGESISSAMSFSTRATEVAIVPVNSCVLPLECMLQLIHNCHYDTSSVMAQLHLRNLDGWSRRQSMFTAWKQEEVDLFELAMTCYPKLFDKISSIVKTRSVAECVVFYFGWKHTPRYNAWLQQMECLDEDEQPSSVSRQLPSRKRKRETELPMDPSERLYLEALDSLEHPYNPSLLNIMLEVPSCLADDPLTASASSPRDDEVTTCGDLSDTTEMAESPSHTSLMHPHPSAAAPIDPRSSGFELPRLLPAASPKRLKLEESDDTHMLHTIDLNSSTTIDPTTIVYPNSILAIPEPTIDFFMHF